MTTAAQLAAGNDFVFEHIYALEDWMVSQLLERYQAALVRMMGQMAASWASFVDGDTWSQSDVQALDNMMMQIRQEMFFLHEEAAAEILNAMTDAFNGSMYGTGFAMDNTIMSQLATGVQFQVLPTAAIRAQLIQPYVGKTWGGYFTGARDEFEQRIRMSLIDSQIAGESIGDAMKRLSSELGITINDTFAGTAYERNFNRIQMIARTEILRASNLGALAVYKQNRDILQGWQWLTAVDERVCKICASLDGERFTFGGTPFNQGLQSRANIPPPAHPMCRCTVIPVVNDEFRDLEQRIDKGTRATVEGPVQLKNFREWVEAKGLDKNAYGQMYDLRRKAPPQLRLTDA